MYHHQQNTQYPFGGYPYQPQAYYPPNRGHFPHLFHMWRQQPIRGQATWTEGGPVTQCGIPWSENSYMTVAVGGNAPYECGEAIKVRYPTTGRELIVTVVDRVPGYPANQINLHRQAFEALGANLDAGVINVEIIPSPNLEEEKWGKYLLEVTKIAYPGYNVVDYSFVNKTELSPTKVREVYDFVLQSPTEKIKIRGRVTYNPNTDRVLSFNLEEA
ncbi:DUF3889 domain-containing protein [Aquibacillus sp. 3ASR75-11]|uniref:DUF3889 domain-containing protein n=1 Tax=Terrihalobacillus insolitus TaxID=2950438 RepID=A0A9X4AKL8_9BACI|nr:DUF3889 domain-containing protein [Terrihalobacillus insolitus]MDC3412071.1 DUF3889 domain-containing protein [Terrihalobacillus insolitus]MDC3423236.1 DUF3889 domain-containing protein [Terrihalobacillus insolitus]